MEDKRINLRKVSVIVPVYNVEAYLEECVKSIQGQTYSNLEIILIDDGSTDNSRYMCDRICQEDERVIVIHQANKGLSAARNCGLDIATGDYICFVDSDDWIDSEMIQTMVERMERDESDLVICNFYKFRKNGADIQNVRNVQIEDSILDLPGLLHQFVCITDEMFVVAWNKLYQRKLFKTLRFPEGFIHEDNAIIHYIYGMCECISIVSKQLYHYRQNPVSIMGKKFNVQRTDDLSAYADRIRYAYRMKWKEVVGVAVKRYAIWFWEWYFMFPDNEENHKYILRMEKSLKVALPHIWRSNEVLISHKIWMSLIAINPKLYKHVNRIFRKIKK